MSDKTREDVEILGVNHTLAIDPDSLNEAGVVWAPAVRALASAIAPVVVAEAERKIKDSEGIERRGVILATLSKLKQVCNHPAHFLGDESELGRRSGKLIRLSEMLEELAEAGVEGGTLRMVLPPVSYATRGGEIIASQLNELGFEVDIQNVEAFEPIGISCRICPRENCHQRAVPPLEPDLNVDPNLRGILPHTARKHSA